MYDTLRVLAGQLLSVPGAPESLLTDYFSCAVPEALPLDSETNVVELWHLPDSSQLVLVDRAGGVTLEFSGRNSPMDGLSLPLPGEILTAASQRGDQQRGPYLVSPLALTLTAMAAGYIDGDKLLRKAVPALLKGAQEVLLIAACRLCG